MDDTNIPIRQRYTYTVIGTDTDVLDRLTPHALFAYKQESATVHAYQLGMSRYVDEAKGAWLLRRSRARWFRRPGFRDEVTVETWSRGVSLVTFLRDFRFYVNGDFSEPAGVGSSEWIIAAKEAHKPLRPFDVIPADLVKRLSVDDAAMEDKAPRLTPPATQLDYVMDRTIGYAEIDHNYHVNNTFYLRYGMDAVAALLVSEGRLGQTGIDIAGMDALYLRELSLGDTLQMYVAEDASGWFCEGRKGDDVVCFRLKLTPFA